MPTEAKENFGRLIFQGVENLAEKKLVVRQTFKSIISQIL